MPANLQLKLLELTTQSRAVDIEDLEAAQQAGLTAKLNSLRERGLVSISNGLLRMDRQQRMMLAEGLIRAGGDPKRISRFLGWQEFEDFTQHTFSANGFQTVKHFIFKSKTRKREIDILAWNDTLTFAVDCKHWLRGLSTGQMRDIAKAQVDRVIALATRPDLLKRLKIDHTERRSIIPVILALSDVREHMVDGVPVVSVSKLLSFIYGVSPVDDGMQRIPLSDLGTQSRLM